MGLLKIEFKLGRRTMAFVAVLAILLGMMNACYFDNAEELFACSPLDVSYTNDVEPILEARCYGCHDLSNSPSLGSGINLEGYSNLYSFLQDNSDRLIGAINWDGGGTPMPKDGDKLDNCSISKIEVWIEEGTRNN